VGDRSRPDTGKLEGTRAGSTGTFTGVQIIVTMQTSTAMNAAASASWIWSSVRPNLLQPPTTNRTGPPLSDCQVRYSVRKTAGARTKHQDTNLDDDVRRRH